MPDAAEEESELSSSTGGAGEGTADHGPWPANGSPAAMVDTNSVRPCQQLSYSFRSLPAQTTQKRNEAVVPQLQRGDSDKRSGYTTEDTTFRAQAYNCGRVPSVAGQR